MASTSTEDHSPDASRRMPFSNGLRRDRDTASYLSPHNINSPATQSSSPLASNSTTTRPFPIPYTDGPSPSAVEESTSLREPRHSTSDSGIPGAGSALSTTSSAHRVSWHMSVSPGARSGSGSSVQRRLSSRQLGTTAQEEVREEENQGESSSADETTAIMERAGGRDYGGAMAAAKARSEESGMAETEESIDRRSEASRSGSALNGQRGVRKRTSSGQRKGGDGEQEEGESWWRKLVDKYGSIELENKGSVARDHLALERTFLAWLRTSLSFASIGVAVTQLFRLNTSLAADGNGSSSSSSSSSETLPIAASRLRQVGKPLGATFLAIAIIILGIGFHRYFESQHYVIRGKFPASRASVLLVSFVAMALIVASLVVVIAVAPAAFES